MAGRGGPAGEGITGHPRVVDGPDAGCHKVGGHVGEPAWGAAKVGANEVECINSVRITIDNDTLIDQHGG